MAKHLLALAVILTGVTGCDNVAWGGVEMELRPPPVSEVPEDTSQVSVPDSAVKVPGPVLLAGSREGIRADLVVVGELLADGLNPFPDPDFPGDAARLAELSAPGSEWILFSEGVRVGRMVTESAGAAGDFCGARTSVSGVVELVPSAAEAGRLLALPAGDLDRYPYETYVAYDHVYDQRVATLSMAGEAIPRFGAPWPEEGVLEARAHIQAFQLADQTAPWIAATFVHEDQLGVGSPRQGAYSLFVLGSPRGGEYGEAFTWFQSVEEEGKAVPRYFDHLDWDDDGQDEILLEVFGSNRRWFAGLDRREGGWVRTFRDACTSGAGAGGG